MPDQRIDQLNAETTPAAVDVLPVFSIAGSDTKKITVKNLVQVGAGLVDDASIPVAKVNLSGISGTNLSAGTVAASKLDTSTIPATGGVTVSSSNLQLVAPTSPIVRNAGTGSLEHATSGATAGTYTKVTVDTKGHVTVGAAVAAADLPIAISGTVGVMSPGTGLSVTGGGVLNHTSSITAGTTSGITFDAQGHITGAVALTGANLPVATSGVKGAVRPGTGLTVDVNGILDVSAATNAVLGGVIASSDFSVSTGTISLAAQAGVAAGQYTKLTVNGKGIVTSATGLAAGDIPNLATSQITSGTLGVDRYGANTITGAKLANYATGKISEAFPSADYISQLFFNPLEKTLYMWDGNVYQPIGVSFGQVVFSGTYDASTNLITSVTVEGAAIGLTVGGALVSPVAATKAHYVVVDQPGTGTAPAPAVALSPPDMLLSNGSSYILLDVSDTVTAQLASNIQVSPAGNIASTNVQSALQELDDEKLPLAGGTLTGNLALNTGIAIVYEGSTTDNFETTLFVVDPTADRTILLPNVSGTVVTTGDTGTVTSTMLLNDTILNADINASAAIVDTKLDTIATALKVSNSATTATNANTASAIVARDASGNFTAGTITATLTGNASTVTTNANLTGDVTSTGNATAIAAGVIVNADVNASAAIAGTKIAPDFGAQTITTTGVISPALGTAALPSVAFTGDLNTGMFSPGADQVAISTNGVARLTTSTTAVSSSLAVDHPLGAEATPSITFTGDLNTGFYSPAADTLAAVTAGSNRLHITSGGLVLVGTSSATGANLLQVNSDARINGITVGRGLASVSTNTAVGDGALSANTDGISNAAVGYRALYVNTTGTNNTAIGREALTAITTGNNTTAVGAYALAACISGSSNTAFGTSVLEYNTGSNNTGIGRDALQLNTTGTNNTGIGYQATGASASTSNAVTLGNSSVATLRCAVTTITAISDARDKTNIINLPAGLDFINALRPVAFDWNTRDGAKVGIHEFGFIAQELQEAQASTGVTVPNLVSTENPEKLEASPGVLLPILINAVKQLSAQNAALEARLAALETA